MIQKTDQKYYKVPGFMYGYAVDEELKDELTTLTNDFKEKLTKLFRDNPEHLHRVYQETCYPFGKYTNFHYAQRYKSVFAPDPFEKITEYLNVVDCGLVLETDEEYSSERDEKLRRLAQKIMEEEQ